MSDPAFLPREPFVLVVFGVSGSGKSTIAERLATQLHVSYEEGDDLHPQANIDKMSAGHPLSDADRAPWLARVAAWIDGCLDAGRSGVITCSALKQRYRNRLARPGVIFVYLRGDRDTIAARLGHRHGHFMPSTLLASQFADLEEPDPDDDTVITVDIRPDPVTITNAVLTRLADRGLNEY